MNTAKASFQPLQTTQKLDGAFLSSSAGRKWIESEALAQWIPTRRWFGGKAREVRSFVIEGAVPVAGAEAQAYAVRVEYADGAPELYSVPLACVPAAEIEESAAATIALGADGTALCDATFFAPFRAALLDLMWSGGTAGEAPSMLCGTPGKLLGTTARPQRSRVLGVEQSNTSILWDDRLFVKLFRRLQSGTNPDAEITRFLSERQSFSSVPPFGGEVQLALDGGEAMPFALMLGCVENHGDAWSWALKQLGEYFASGESSPAPATLERIAQLGRRTAELHLALAADDSDPDFAPEPLTGDDFHRLADSIVLRFDALRPKLRASSNPLAVQVESRAEDFAARIAAVAQLPAGALKTRHHGDYHLGQVLDTGSDWMIIDFEGEPLRLLIERRAKRSPLRDVAGMLRSLHYAPHAAKPNSEPETVARAERWSDAAGHAFLGAYLATAGAASFLPADPAERDALLAAFVLEKALYEIDYELNNRPDWLAIPLQGALKVLA